MASSPSDVILLSDDDDEESSGAASDVQWNHVTKTVDTELDDVMEFSMLIPQGDNEFDYVVVRVAEDWGQKEPSPVAAVSVDQDVAMTTPDTSQQSSSQFRIDSCEGLRSDDVTHEPTSTMAHQDTSNNIFSNSAASANLGVVMNPPSSSSLPDVGFESPPRLLDSSEISDQHKDEDQLNGLKIRIQSVAGYSDFAGELVTGSHSSPSLPNDHVADHFTTPPGGDVTEPRTAMEVGEWKKKCDDDEKRNDVEQVSESHWSPIESDEKFKILKPFADFHREITERYLKQSSASAGNTDNVLPHVCSSCSKRFATAHQLNSHRAIHTRNDPSASRHVRRRKATTGVTKFFDCPSCDRTMSTMWAWYQHVASHVRHARIASLHSGEEHVGRERPTAKFTDEDYQRLILDDGLPNVNHRRHSHVVDIATATGQQPHGLMNVSSVDPVTRRHIPGGIDIHRPSFRSESERSPRFPFDGDDRRRVPGEVTTGDEDVRQLDDWLAAISENLPPAEPGVWSRDPGRAQLGAWPPVAIPHQPQYPPSASWSVPGLYGSGPYGYGPRQVWIPGAAVPPIPPMSIGRGIPLVTYNSFGYQPAYESPQCEPVLGELGFLDGRRVPPSGQMRNESVAYVTDPNSVGSHRYDVDVGVHERPVPPFNMFQGQPRGPRADDGHIRYISNSNNAWLSPPIVDNSYQFYPNTPDHVRTMYQPTAASACGYAVRQTGVYGGGDRLNQHRLQQHQQLVQERQRAIDHQMRQEQQNIMRQLSQCQDGSPENLAAVPTSLQRRIHCYLLGDQLGADSSTTSPMDISGPDPQHHPEQMSSVPNWDFNTVHCVHVDEKVRRDTTGVIMDSNNNNNSSNSSVVVSGPRLDDVILHPVKIEPEECEQCGKRDEPLHAMMTSLGDDSMFVCEFCRKELTLRNRLKVRIRVGSNDKLRRPRGRPRKAQDSYSAAVEQSSLAGPRKLVSMHPCTDAGSS